MNRAEVQIWLESVPVLVAPRDSKEQEELVKLVGHPGFAAFLGLMLGAREAQYQALANIPLSNMEGAARASVLQGIIKGIDLTRQTVLELFPADEATEGAKP
jgi:hypothetical protein